MLLSQIKQFVRQLPAGRRALVLVWGAAGWWTLAWGVLLVGQGLIPAGLALCNHEEPQAWPVSFI